MRTVLHSGFTMNVSTSEGAQRGNRFALNVQMYNVITFYEHSRTIGILYITKHVAYYRKWRIFFYANIKDSVKINHGHCLKTS